MASDDKPGGSTPSQYGLPAGATDLQDLIEHRGMNFAMGNIFKACYRRGTCSHSDELRDMRKIKWFAEREIARMEARDRAAAGTVYGDLAKIGVQESNLPSCYGRFPRNLVDRAEYDCEHCDLIGGCQAHTNWPIP